VKLRTKFLLSFCAILFGFGAATVQVVKRIVEIQIRQVLMGDLRNSVTTFRSFESVSDEKLIVVSELVASMPALKALMTTQDVTTIQDGSDALSQLAGSDLFVLSDQSGVVVAVHSKIADVGVHTHDVFNTSMPDTGRHSWTFIGNHLFETVSQPIYFGPLDNSRLLGIVTVGYQINDNVTKTVAAIAASKVAFQYGDTIVSSTLTPSQLKHIPANVDVPEDKMGAFEVKIEGERFVATSLLLADAPKPVRLIVLKSFDQASVFLKRVNEIVIAMNAIAICIGSILVVFISHKFTKPLGRLLEGVRALEQRNFNYPLFRSGNDELAELTSAFDEMRSSLAAAEEKLLEAERSATIGRMASSISHDLRHRLTAIMANAEFLAESDLSPKRKLELYENVQGAIRKMTDLLESLLELSRTTQSLRREHVSMEEIVEASIAAIRLHPQFRSVHIGIYCAERISGSFDPRILERGLYNLLLNACEMVSSETGLIEIKIQKLGSDVEIRVCDNGPGIAECIREKLFLPFVSHGKQHGSGLGLAIVQKACQDHGGKLLVENANPGSTTFLMALPLGSEATAENFQQELSACGLPYA
jgi:signal transduction histidine kinase